MTINTSKLKKIDTEGEYWEQNAIYEERLRILNKTSPIVIMRDLKAHLDKLYDIFDEMEYIGLHDHEFILERKLKITKSFNIPDEIKKWSLEKRRLFFEKLKRKKIKKEEINEIIETTN